MAQDPNRPIRPVGDRGQNVYQESAEALRTLTIDENGDEINASNPLPVSPVTDYGNEVSLGNIPNTKRIFISASNLNLGATEELISEISGMYQFLTTATQLNLVSTDANDTAAGTGAQSVVIEYLDANDNEQVEVIALNGTTPVLTTASIFRINGMSVFSVGSSNEHLGVISISDVGNVLGIIQPNEFRLRQAIYSVPANKVALFRSLVVSSGKNDEVELILRGKVRTLHEGNQLFTKAFAFQNSIDIINTLPSAFPEKTDININAFKTGSAGSARVTVAFELEIKDI